MFKFIKAMRISDCLLMVTIGLIGFKYAGVPYSILLLVALFSVITVTMLQNDWRDRVHDIGKGKMLATQKPFLFLCWLIFFWILCVVLVSMVVFKYHFWGILFVGMALVGAIYSEARRIPLLSVTIVTITVASTTLLPMVFGVEFKMLWPLFVSVALIMFGRETLHDIADIEVDRGYKKTVPIVFGDKFARTISTITLLIGCGILISISAASVVGTIFVAWGLSKVYKETRLITSRKKIDFGFLLLCIGLLFF